MTTTVLDEIPFAIDFEQVVESLRIPADSDPARQIREMAEQARSVAKPKGVYRIAFIDSRDDHSVVIDGIRFTSRVLRVNLDEVERVFPFVATCGEEMDGWSDTFEDMFRRYCADVLKEAALEAAVRALGESLVETYRPGATSMMHPGSLDDWPIEEQGNLFDLLGDAPSAIGVRLSDSFLMTPIKSVSGLWFPTETGFESCQLCPREKCPKRRAPYDRDLFAREYKE